MDRNAIIHYVTVIVAKPIFNCKLLERQGLLALARLAQWQEVVLYGPQELAVIRRRLKPYKDTAVSSFDPADTSSVLLFQPRDCNLQAVAEMGWWQRLDGEEFSKESLGKKDRVSGFT